MHRDPPLSSFCQSAGYVGNEPSCSQVAPVLGICDCRILKVGPILCKSQLGRKKKKSQDTTQILQARSWTVIRLGQWSLFLDGRPIGVVLVFPM